MNRSLSTVAPALVTVPWRTYLRLCKPRVVALVVFTALVAMLLAAPPGQVPWTLLLTATLGIAMAGASAAAFNQVADRDIDARMRRTRRRPLPSGSLTVGAAAWFAGLLGAAALVLLWWAVNPLTAVLTLFTLIGYAVIYTRYLKWLGPQNIVLGGVAGAAPVLLGWCAVSGRLEWAAVSLFLIVLVWTPPHFWALAIARRDEYAEAGVPMLPVTHGVAYTRRAILVYAVLLLPVTLLPGVAGLSGPLYLTGATVLGLLFILRAFRLQQTVSDRAALRLFRYSITYLTLLFALLLADHFLANF
jgi:protoheme IX farnesyltransferase